MKRYISIMVFLGVAVIGCCLTGCTTVKIWPRSSEAKIREKVLKYTPLGASTEQVMTFIQTQLWHRYKGTAKIEKFGALKRNFNGPDQIIGVMSIEGVDVGRHATIFWPVPLITYVYLSWAFDEDGRLIDVIVHKEIDSV